MASDVAGRRGLRSRADGVGGAESAAPPSGPLADRRERSAATTGGLTTGRGCASLGTSSTARVVASHSEGAVHQDDHRSRAGYERETTRERIRRKRRRAETIRLLSVAALVLTVAGLVVGLAAWQRDRTTASTPPQSVGAPEVSAADVDGVWLLQEEIAALDPALQAAHRARWDRSRCRSPKLHPVRHDIHRGGRLGFEDLDRRCGLGVVHSGRARRSAGCGGRPSLTTRAPLIPRQASAIDGSVPAAPFGGGRFRH